MNLNNIDDIFKEGLEGYSEEVSKGVWKKISGGLLRHEISRFNFTNVPKLWVGMAAAGIVAIFVTVYQWGPTPQPLQQNIALTEEQTPGTEFTTPNEQIITQNQTGKDNQPDGASSNILHPVENAGQANNQGIHSIDDNVAFTEPDHSSAESDNAENSIMLTGTSSQDELSFFSPFTAEEEMQAQQNETGGEGTDETVEITTMEAVTFTEDNPGGAQPVPDEVTANETTSATTTPQGETRVEENAITFTQLDTRKANLKTEESQPIIDEIHSTTQLDMAVTPLTKRKPESKKIQKMHTLSYSFGQFFKGKYKPPKRRFNENSFSKFQGNKPYFSLSAYFAPELTTYTRVTSTSMEKSYLAGLAVSYHSTRFVFEGGVEASHSFDQGDYLVDMDTYDSIGWYQGIGGFGPDPNNPDSIIFNTQQVLVYDSVQHNSYQQTQNQYTYLQFPLMIGYQAMDRGIFSAYIKAGPSFSFLLNKKEPPLEYFNPDATINQIENYTPARMSTSIQVLVSVAMKFQFTEKFGLLIEPTYRYYLKSVYNDKNFALKNPYSFGIRTGLFLDL